MPASTMSWIEPVLERYERPLIQYALSICGNGENARDAVQDTFIRLARNGAIAPDRLAPWLFTVCRNRAIDLRRKEDRIVPMNPELQESESTDATPSAFLEQKETTLRLSRLLERLPDNQREVIRLRFQCDLSYREIGEVTKLSATNVGFLIHTALKKLRQLWPENLEVN